MQRNNPQWKQADQTKSLVSFSNPLTAVHGILAPSDSLWLDQTLHQDVRGQTEEEDREYKDCEEHEAQRCHLLAT